MKRIYKLIYFLRFLLIAPFFKRVKFVNFIQHGVSFVGYSDITLGANNIFKRYSRISVDYKSSDQYLVIGNCNTFDSMSVIRSQGGYIYIGDNNYIGDRCQIMGLGGVEIGHNSMIAANVFISSSNHDYSEPESDDYLLKERGKKTVIGNHVWIGANSVITSGVKIGDYSIVGAGSVVTKDIPDYHMAMGNPSKLFKKYDSKKQIWIHL